MCNKSTLTVGQAIEFHAEGWLRKADLSFVGRTPSSALAPLVRLFQHTKAEADGGVGRSHCS
jgi:hypothetical protein